MLAAKYSLEQSEQDHLVSLNSLIGIGTCFQAGGLAYGLSKSKIEYFQYTIPLLYKLSIGVVLKNAIMSIINTRSKNKINQLIQNWPKWVVGTQRWLDAQGVNRFLAQQYCRSGWIERIGQGAYQLAGDSLKWTGAVYALQSQLKFAVHVAAQTALEIQGYRQYVAQNRVIHSVSGSRSGSRVNSVSGSRSGSRVNSVSGSKGQPIWLLKSFEEKRKLPQWFLENFEQQYNVHCVTRALFDDDQLGLAVFAINDYELIVSTPERAVLEYLNLAPTHFSLEQTQFLIEGMMTLRPELLQSLLEYCTSIKTKRLFLVLSEHEGHLWWNSLNLEKLALGMNKLTIGKGGYYYPRYQLSLPLKLGTYEGYHEDDESIP